VAESENEMRKRRYFKSGLSFIIAVFIIIPLLAGSLVSCADEPETPTTPTATPTSPPATTPDPVEPHDGLPLVSFDSGSFAGSSNCAVCHRNLKDESGADVSIDSHWRSTIMANAARDPYFLAKVSAEIVNAPHLQETIEDVCGTCHTPMARTQALADGTDSLLFDPGFLSTENDLHKAGIDGVSCTLCHQVQPDGLGTEDTFGGNYAIDTSTSSPDRLIFSQFPDSEQQVMAGASGFTPVYGEHLSDSGLCATCHTVITPVLDAEGEVRDTFPEQAPFLEWAHSSYSGNKECQDCHMPSAVGGVPTANMPPNMDPKSPFSQHFFVGGNIHMLEILRDNPDALGVTASTDNFNETIKRALDQLQNDTATVSIVDSGIDGDTLTVAVNVENHAGHKFPTGFPSRRAWIHFEVLDNEGNVVFESGRPYVDGSIGGNRADEEIYAHEPHYDLITSPDQVQIYEAILQTLEGDVTHTLLLASTYAKDNRLLPDGFDKTTACDMIAVWGDAVNDDSFTGGSDTVTYQVDTAGFSGPYTVKINFYYQSMAYSSVNALFEVDTPEVAAFKEYFDASDKTPKLVDSVTMEIS